MTVFLRQLVLDYYATVPSQEVPSDLEDSLFLLEGIIVTSEEEFSQAIRRESNWWTLKAMLSLLSDVPLSECTTAVADLLYYPDIHVQTLAVTAVHCCSGGAKGSEILERLRHSDRRVSLAAAEACNLANELAPAEDLLSGLQDKSVAPIVRAALLPAMFTKLIMEDNSKSLRESAIESARSLLHSNDLEFVSLINVLHFLQSTSALRASDRAYAMSFIYPAEQSEAIRMVLGD